uniref:Uncharacterized protein n=1 Tax=Brassica campestris TaxID=3711 RepID=M4F5L4_BRACM
MDTPQRVLVAESARPLREEREAATLIARDGHGGASEGEASVPDFVPFDHPDSASYPEEFIANARAVVSRVHVSWKDITVERIRGAIDRISRRDWRSDLPPLITDIP